MTVAPQALRAALAGVLAEQGQVTLVRLSDEELAAVQPLPDGADFVVTPYLDGLDPSSREQAIVSAFRSLSARGMVEPADPAALATRLGAADNAADNGADNGADDSGEDPVTVDLRFSADLHLALTLRRAADAVLVLDQTTADSKLWHYLHLLPGGTCLDEQVDRAGMHTFSLLRAEAAAEVAVGVCNPLGLAGRDGEPCALDSDAVGPALGSVLDADDRPLHGLVSGTSVLTEMLLVRADEGDGHGTLYGVYSGGDGIRLTESRPTSAPGRLTVCEVCDRTLRRLVGRLLAPLPGTGG